ncbi:hypothetical protein PT974_05148 [Cladobotryum mycophilum]|uniref:Uncharacterized protein n=1 Tax=Cladobotryum mycophilum TaxID=491253 RepID=A0ABR0SR56_9HYPO
MNVSDNACRVVPCIKEKKAGLQDISSAHSKRTEGIGRKNALRFASTTKRPG